MAQLPDLPEPAGADAGHPAGEGPATPAGSGAGEAAFGRYTSKRGEVLLRFDRESGDWKRLPPMSPLAKGDRLLSLPLFRPSIALSTSITLQPDGAAELALTGWTAEGVPIIAIEHGRLLMMTVGKAGNSIQLNLGDHHVELMFVDAESTVALEARRVLPPGSDPTLATAPLGVDLYITSGAVRVRLDDGPPLDLQAPVRRALVGDGLEPAGEVPSWVTSEALSDFDRRATATLESLLPPDQFAGLLLKELSTDRRREVSSLAIRGAACVGNFEPCIEALNEKVEKSFWPAYIEELQAAIALSPEMAKRVSNAFDKLRGADGPALFRMLWGYTPEDLQAGAAADLVESLNHDSLDHRVLAIWNLQEITGPANYGYYPENLVRGRTVAVNRWKERLRQGKIVPRAAERPKASGKP